jgi:TonB family protein
MVAEPVSDSRLSRVIGKVPLLRRLRKQQQTTPPVPSYQAQPTLEPVEKQGMLQPASVAVKVYVAESGAVKRAEVLEYGNPPNWTLANASLAAARKWTFQPARLDDMAVSSEVILHFRFNP